jgi:hypothetical protein
LEDHKEEAMSAARFKQVADASRIEKAVSALNAKGFAAQSVPNAAAAKEAVLKLIPAGSEVFTYSSVTLDAVGITGVLNAAPYVSLRDKMYALDRNTQSAQMRTIASAPAYAAGSVQAVTEDGVLVMASASGSQFPAYAYGAGHVVFVVGAQKIVKDIAEANERIATYAFPLEDVRAQAAYGVNSAINKSLVLHGEQPGRIDVIIVAEELGF